MRRRDFLRKGTVAVGLASSPRLIAPLTASESSPQKPSRISSRNSGQTGAAQEENRSADYLRRVQGDEFLPKPPAFAELSRLAAVQISPMLMAERVKRKIVPRRGFCSIAPGATLNEGLTSGNGAMNIEMTCDPYSEQILFHHESLMMPYKRPYEAPKVADMFPQVRQMVLDRKYREAVEFAFKEMEKGPIKRNTWPHPTIPAFMMRLDFPKTASVKDYLRTVDFECSEVKVHWSDERGEWLRRTFTSRLDNVVVQWFIAPKGQLVNVRIALQKSGGGMFGANSGQSDVYQDFNEQRLVYRCRLDPSVDNSGYAGVTRVVRSEGSARMEGSTLVIENASSVMLLTRIEWFADNSEDKVEALRLAVERLTPDYPALLERHRKVQSEALNRVTVDFGGASQYGMSSEELLADQRSRPDYSPALLEKIFEMGRHWFILTSGKYPSISAEVNANINLQISPGPQGDMREGMDAYFNWMESLAPDFRVNAKNIFGMRGTHYSLWPDKEMGVVFHWSSAGSTGEMWPHPYWLSAGGWCVRPFWDHYLVTGDLEFLRKRVVPALKELAFFKNIPFAQPPVGDLRWKEPSPAKAWTGVRDATAFGPMCHQNDNKQLPHSEDCLQLNVWTPKWPMKSSVPVMAWFHGGGNFAGSGVEPLFNGEVLARNGVVLVTTNYQLGIFGFFAHPELTKESAHHASGNYGLMDQIQALRWVQQNIAKFGGNPANVTIFGESAGAGDVNALIASPLTKGLFVRAIAQSGPISDQTSLADAEKRDVEWAAKLGITGDQILAKLRAIPDTELMDKLGQGGGPGGPGMGGSGPMMGIVIDGWVLPAQPTKIYADGREQKVALMIGNNSQEFGAGMMGMMGGRSATPPPDIRQMISQRYGPLADRALAAYGLSGQSDPPPDPEDGTVMTQWSTDNSFRCGTVQELIWHTAAGNPAYEYQFSRTVHGQEAQGAPHASEIPFIFGTLSVWQQMRKYNESDQQYAPQMQQYWTNFAKTGDPNGGSLVKWPKFDASKRAYIDSTDAGPVVKEGLRRGVCDLFMENEKRQAK